MAELAESEDENVKLSTIEGPIPKALREYMHGTEKERAELVDQVALMSSAIMEI